MSKISISLVEGTHLTATDKRHIAEIIRRGWTKGATRRRQYSISEREGDTARLIIEWNERDDYGRLQTRTSKMKIRIKGETENV